jgi:hypothetical protein
VVKLDDIADAVRQRIATEAAPLLHKLDSVGLGAPAQKLILGSSLREEMLPLDALHAPGGPAVALRPTGQTLTIIQAPNDHPTLGAGPGQPPLAVGYVRSGDAAGEAHPMATSGEDRTVTSVSSSDLSSRIEAALAWIDRNVQPEPLVRVLSVPSYHVTALSLYRDDKLVGVVVVTPPQGTTQLQKEHLYAPEEFYALLRAQQPALGLTL